MTTNPDTRDSLIQRLPDRADADAWQQFLELYQPLLLRLGRQRGLQPVDAEDFVQEVLTAVAKSIDSWTERENPGPFRAWLFRIAQNLAVNFLTRRRHQRLGAGGSDAQQMFAQHADAGRDEHSSFQLEYRRELFRWAAEQVRATVSEPVWDAFWQSSVEDKPIKQVADDLGVTVGAVYVSRSRITRRIGDVVRRHEEQTE